MVIIVSCHLIYYENMLMQYSEIFFSFVEIKNFIGIFFFSYFCSKQIFGTERPRRGSSKEYPQSMFRQGGCNAYPQTRCLGAKIGKSRYTLAYPSVAI